MSNASKIVLWRKLQACALWGCVLFNAPAWLLVLLVPDQLKEALHRLPLPFVERLEPIVVLAPISTMLVLLLVVTHIRRLQALEEAPEDTQS